MSADNGIYILESLTQDANVEYRVAHAQAIENIESDDNQEGDYYKVLIFGKLDIYTDKKQALIRANEIYEELEAEGYPIEYGIRTIKQTTEFPQITYREACKHCFGH